MAIALDAATGGGVNSVFSDLTYSHTVGSGSDRILFVGAWGDTGTDDMTADYNGVSMTKIASNNDAGDRWVVIWGLSSPAVGAHNVVVHRGSSPFVSSSCASYFGASGVIDNYATDSGGETIIDIFTADSWVIYINKDGYTDYGTGIFRIGSGSDRLTLGDSNGPQAINSIHFGTVDGGGNNVILVSFMPVVAPPVVSDPHIIFRNRDYA